VAGLESRVGAELSVRPRLKNALVSKGASVGKNTGAGKNKFFAGPTGQSRFVKGSYQTSSPGIYQDAETPRFDPRPHLSGNPGPIAGIRISAPKLSDQCQPGQPWCNQSASSIGIECPNNERFEICVQRKSILQRARDCFQKAVGDVIDDRSAIGLCSRPGGKRVLISQPIYALNGLRKSAVQITNDLAKECRTHKSTLRSLFVPYA
jgi:hypothetical protein